MNKWQVKWSDDEYGDQVASFDTREEAQKWIQSSLAKEKIEPSGFDCDSPKEVELKPFEAGKLYRVGDNKYILVVGRSDDRIKCLDVTASMFKASPKVIVSRVEQAPDGSERATAFDEVDSQNDFCDPVADGELYAMMKKNDVARAFLQKAGIILKEDKMLPSKSLILGNECTKDEIINELLKLKKAYAAIAPNDQETSKLFDKLGFYIGYDEDEWNKLQESLAFLKKHWSK